MFRIERSAYNEDLRDLLLLADPSEEEIESYIHTSQLWVCKDKGTTKGVLVIQSIQTNIFEVMNVSVHPAYQRQGIGRKLLEHVLSFMSKGSVVRICTGNSSTYQLKLYQQVGFELVEVKWNYFIEHYEEPIFEEGIQCKHQMVLQQNI